MSWTDLSDPCTVVSLHPWALRPLDPLLRGRPGVSERNIAHKLWTEILEGVLLKDFGVMQSLGFWKVQVWRFVEVRILVRQLGSFATLYASGHAVANTVTACHQLLAGDLAATDSTGGWLKVLLKIVNKLLAWAAA